MREEIEKILSDFVKGKDEPETTIDKLCDLSIVSKRFFVAEEDEHGEVSIVEGSESDSKEEAQKYIDGLKNNHLWNWRKLIILNAC